MLGKTFFEIPIYRCNMEHHTDEMNKDKERHINLSLEFSGARTQRERECVIQSAESAFDRSQWYPWRYNEAIGWIRLCQHGRRITGELWFIRAKKIRKGLVRKRFYYHTGKIIELNFRPEDSSERVFCRVCNELERLSCGSRLRKHYVDLQAFQAIGSFVNWRRLLRFENRQTVDKTKHC